LWHWKYVTAVLDMTVSEEKKILMRNCLTVTCRVCSYTDVRPMTDCRWTVLASARHPVSTRSSRDNAWHTYVDSQLATSVRLRFHSLLLRTKLVNWWFLPAGCVSVVPRPVDSGVQRAEFHQLRNCYVRLLSCTYITCVTSEAVVNQFTQCRCHVLCWFCWYLPFSFSTHCSDSFWKSVVVQDPSQWPVYYIEPLCRQHLIPYCVIPYH